MLLCNSSRHSEGENDLELPQQVPRCTLHELDKAFFWKTVFIKNKMYQVRSILITDSPTPREKNNVVQAEVNSQYLLFSRRLDLFRVTQPNGTAFSASSSRPRARHKEARLG